MIRVYFVVSKTQKKMKIFIGLDCMIKCVVIINRKIVMILKIYGR